MVLVVSYDVFTRYLLKESSVWIQELEWHLFAVLFLMGAAYTFLTDNHVRVDLIFAKFSKKNQAWINLFGIIFFLIPFCLLVIYSSRHFVLSSFAIGETSPDPGGLPARYILKSILPISFLILLLQGISQVFKSILIIKNPEDKEL